MSDAGAKELKKADPGFLATAARSPRLKIGLLPGMMIALAIWGAVVAARAVPSLIHGSVVAGSFAIFVAGWAVLLFVRRKAMS